MKSMIALSQKFALLFSFAFAPRAISITRMLRKSAERRTDVNSRQIQIDSFHLPSPTVRSSSVIGIVSATKRERKRGREGESGERALSNPLSNLPPLCRFSIVKGTAAWAVGVASQSDLGRNEEILF